MGPTPDKGVAPVGCGIEHSVLALGPPRSGKTSAIVVPSILHAPGTVVSTSTKGDVMAATFAWRSQMGTCYVFDPTGMVEFPDGAVALRWSPVTGCADWETACAMAHSLARAGRPSAKIGESAHWIERAEALLSPLLHAAALGKRDMAAVCRWVLAQDVREPGAILEDAGAAMPRIILSSIWRTEERERSGIFSTTSGVLSAYRSTAVLDAACRPNFDPAAFVSRYETLYICAPSEAQDRLTPLVVALVEQIRAAVYARHARNCDATPVLFALDEVANIAPLPSLPSLAAEGAGQGLVTLACMQDLSQGRARWGTAAEGFFSIFSAKVILPGIGDPWTLQLLTGLGGEHQVLTVSQSVPDTFAVLGGQGFRSTTYSTTWRPRFPMDAINQLQPGTALCLVPGHGLQRVLVVPWFEVPEWTRRVRGVAAPLSAPNQSGT